MDKTKPGANTFGRRAYLLSAEDVMVTKLRWAHLANRPKDIMDIQAVLHIQGDNLDWPYIEGWCEKHGTRLLLDQLRGELGME